MGYSRILGFSALLCLLAGACAKPMQGDSFGVYEVTAELEGNTCGGTAVPSPTSSSFEMELLRTGQSVMWRTDGTASAVGTMTEAGRVRIETETLVPYSDAKYVEETNSDYGVEVTDLVRKEGCTLRQVDLMDIVVEDTFEESPDGGPRTEPRTFEGTRTLHVVPGPNSDCTDLAAANGGLFLEFPCEIRYDVAGVERLELDESAE